MKTFEQFQLLGEAVAQKRGRKLKVPKKVLIVYYTLKDQDDDDLDVNKGEILVSLSVTDSEAEKIGKEYVDNLNHIQSLFPGKDGPIEFKLKSVKFK